MKRFEDLLKEKLIKYKSIERLTKRYNFEGLEGRLEISEKRGRPEYYHVVRNKGKTRRTYIKKNNLNLAKRLAKKSYIESIARSVKSIVRQLEALDKTFNDNNVYELYSKLHPNRRKLFKPIITSYEELVEKWKNKPYKSNPYTKSREILTNRGELVRSKSEKILADKFYELRIEYKYECPLILNNQTTLYPDFTFLHPFTLEEIYWEHHGLMDNPDYLKNTINKIQLYEKNGIFRGERLIVTYETGEMPLDINWVEKLLNYYFT